MFHRAENEAERVRAEVAQPLIVQAENDGAAYLAAMQAEAAVSARLTTAGRFGRRKARTEHHAAAEQVRTARAQVRDAWGEPPRTPEALPAWAAQAAARRAESDSRVIDAERAVEAARADRDKVRRRHKQERRALLVSEYGAEQARRAQFGMSTINPHRQAQDVRTRATATRAEADELRNLSNNEGARRIEAKRTEEDQSRRRAAERARELHDPFERDPHRRGDSGREGPARGL